MEIRVDAARRVASRWRYTLSCTVMFIGAGACTLESSVASAGWVDVEGRMTTGAGIAVITAALRKQTEKAVDGVSPQQERGTPDAASGTVKLPAFAANDGQPDVAQAAQGGILFCDPAARNAPKECRIQ